VLKLCHSSKLDIILYIFKVLCYNNAALILQAINNKQRNYLYLVGSKIVV